MELVFFKMCKTSLSPQDFYRFHRFVHFDENIEQEIISKQGKLLKKLRTVAWRFAAIKKNLSIVLILHLLFSVFHVFQALSIFVLVNDLYIGDPLEANKTQNICIFQ